MSEWTHKFGYVVPSWNTVVEYETVRMLPDGVSAHFSRIAHTEDTPASLQDMTDNFPSHVKLLEHAGVDAVCYACTGASLARGWADDRKDISLVNKVNGPPVISTAASMIEAARHLGLSNVSVAAPYESWLMQHLVRYLRDAGLHVLRWVGLGEQANVKHDSSAAVELATRAWVPEADGLIMSCGNFRTLEAIQEIEQTIGKPLLTSNICALWALLRSTGWKRSVADKGHLLTNL